MLHFVNFSSECNFSTAIFQSCLAEIDTLAEGDGILSEKKERKTCYKLNLPRVADLDLEFLLSVVIANNKNWLP